MTESGEKWLREVLSTALHYLPPVQHIQRNHLVSFLAKYEDRPWRRHSFYRAFKTFSKWVSQTYDIPNPMVDRWGNPIVEAPKTPDKVLYTMTPQKVHRLVEAARGIRNKAIIYLMADTGGRPKRTNNWYAWRDASANTLPGDNRQHSRTFDRYR